MVYAVPEICDEGPCETTAAALRRAVQHVRQRTIAQRQALDEMAQAYHGLRSKLNQTADGDELAPWRRVFNKQELKEHLRYMAHEGLVRLSSGSWRRHTVAA